MTRYGAPLPARPHIETAKSNGHTPRLWLTRVLEAIGRDREIADYDALLPWAMSPETAAT